MLERSGTRGLPLAARVADRLFEVLVWGTALFLIATFLWIVGDLFWSGLSGVDLDFVTKGVERTGREGGILPILVSTLLILGVCLVVSVPIGTLTAVLLSEYSRRSALFSRLVRASLDVLAGVPSIVFGLFGNAFFCIALKMDFSILSGGLTLACMVLPIFIRSVELGLRAVPDDYRQAGAALGMSQTTLLARVLIPAAAPGIAAGLMLGIGRALAETAALMFTSGYGDRMPESLFDSGRALSLHIYDLTQITGGEPNAYASAVVLIVLLLLVNLLASWSVRRLVGGRVTTH